MGGATGAACERMGLASDMAVNYRGIPAAWLVVCLGLLVVVFGWAPAAWSANARLGEWALSYEFPWERGSSQEEMAEESLILRLQWRQAPLEVYIPEQRARVRLGEDSFLDQLENRWRQRYGATASFSWLEAGGVRWRVCRRPSVEGNATVYQMVTVRGGEAYMLVAMTPLADESVPEPLRELLAISRWGAAGELMQRGFEPPPIESAKDSAQVGEVVAKPAIPPPRSEPAQTLPDQLPQAPPPAVVAGDTAHGTANGLVIAAPDGAVASSVGTDNIAINVTTDVATPPQLPVSPVTPAQITAVETIVSTPVSAVSVPPPAVVEVPVVVKQAIEPAPPPISPLPIATAEGRAAEPAPRMSAIVTPIETQSSAGAALISPPSPDDSVTATAPDTAMPKPMTVPPAPALPAPMMAPVLADTSPTPVARLSDGRSRRQMGRWQLRRTVLSMPEKPDWDALTEIERKRIAGDGLLGGIGLSRLQDGLTWFVEGHAWLPGEQGGEVRRSVGRRWRLNWTAPVQDWEVGEALAIPFAFSTEPSPDMKEGDFLVEVRLAAICAPQSEIIRTFDDLEQGQADAMARLDAMRVNCEPTDLPVPSARIGVGLAELAKTADHRLIRDAMLTLPASWQERIRVRGKEKVRRVIIEARFMASDSGHQLGDDILKPVRLYFVFVPKI